MGKPYIVTEWGPHGHWESPNTDWDAAIEKTSKEKAKAREIAYKHIIDDKFMFRKLCFFMDLNKSILHLVWNFYRR